MVLYTHSRQKQHQAFDTITFSSLSLRGSEKAFQEIIIFENETQKVKILFDEKNAINH